MARFISLTGLCLFVCTRTTIAQVTDTTYLAEVRVYGIPFTTYSTGAKTEKIRIGDEVETLSDKLIDATSLYLKTYGNGQLSSITLRGTTASQTAVLWNGMNINSPTLGQTDFSLIPLFMFDEISIQYGSGSSLYGTDAIGGSIMLGQSPARFDGRFTSSVIQQLGSFGRWNSGVKATYGSRRWEFSTKVYRSFIENNFPYFTKAVGYSKRQDNAAVLNYGINQQIHYKISAAQQISLDGMYTYNFREIQPSVSDTGDETLQDVDTRLAIKYQNNFGAGIFAATTAYSKSDQDYTDDVTSNVRSEQLITLLSFDINVGKKTDFRSGANISRFSVSSENFEKGLAEERYDVFLSVRHSISSSWTVNANFRQSFYAGRYAPFAPTLGTEFYLIRNEKNDLKLRAHASRAFKVPTLNDRYYQPVGNENLKPEDAFNIESGVVWGRKTDHCEYQVDLSVFRTWIDQMIIWQPQSGQWKPENLQKVHIHGIELNAKATWNISRYQIHGNILYGYTRSINQEGVDKIFVDKQLAYVPIHTGRASLAVSRGYWRADTRINFTGLRYVVLDNTTSLDPYVLLDASMGRQFVFDNFSFTMKGEVNNILNTYYENLSSRAMPGRNYAISILLKI